MEIQRLRQKYHRAEISVDYYVGIFNIFVEHNNAWTSEIVAVNYNSSLPLAGSVSVRIWSQYTAA